MMDKIIDGCLKYQYLKKEYIFIINYKMEVKDLLIFNLLHSLKILFGLI